MSVRKFKRKLIIMAKVKLKDVPRLVRGPNAALPTPVHLLAYGNRFKPRRGEPSHLARYLLSKDTIRAVDVPRREMAKVVATAFFWAQNAFEGARMPAKTLNQGLLNPDKTRVTPDHLLTQFPADLGPEVEYYFALETEMTRDHSQSQDKDESAADTGSKIVVTKAGVHLWKYYFEPIWQLAPPSSSTKREFVRWLARGSAFKKMNMRDFEAVLKKRPLLGLDLMNRIAAQVDYGLNDAQRAVNKFAGSLALIHAVTGKLAWQ